jgi:hypothetical protein
VDLAEAVAVGLTSLGQVISDPGDEDQQRGERSQRSPPRGWNRQQRQGDRQLTKRQQDPQRRGQPRGHAEIDQRLPRSGAIGQLRHSSHREHGCQHQARDEQCASHT